MFPWTLIDTVIKNKHLNILMTIKIELGVIFYLIPSYQLSK